MPVEHNADTSTYLFTRTQTRTRRYICVFGLVCIAILCAAHAVTKTDARSLSAGVHLARARAVPSPRFLGHRVFHFCADTVRVHASAEGCLPSRRSVHRTGHPFPLRPRRRRPSADCYIVFAKPTKRTLIRNSVLYLGNLFSTNEKKKTKNTCHRVLRKPGKCRNPSIIKQVEGRQRGRGTPTRSRSRSVAGCTVCATSTRHRRLGFAVGAPTEGGELCTFFFFIKRLLCLVKNLMKSPMCVC